MQIQPCQGPPVPASIIPIEVFYLGSLAVYALFLFFSFFIYARTRTIRSGRAAALSMASIAVYVSASVLAYDTVTPAAHAITQRISWLGASLITVFWLHMVILLRAEERGLQRARDLPWPYAVLIGSCYAVGIALAVGGALLPNSMSGWLWDYTNMHPSPWPNCLWLHYLIETGPYFFIFDSYLLLTLVSSLALLVWMSVEMHRRAASAVNAEEGAAKLATRNKYLWLILATILFATAGQVLAMAVEAGWAMPDSLGQLIFLPCGFIVALVITRHDAFVGEHNVKPDFYRAAASVMLMSASVVAVAYIGESGDVAKTTLLVLVTLSIIFFVNVDKWWYVIDNLFLGPKSAGERALVRSALEDSVADPELIRIKLSYKDWSRETQRVFLLLGEGLSRSTIASSESMHISTVDLHIRRIKDALSTEKLEDIRSLGHKLLLHLRYSPNAEGGNISDLSVERNS